ncbi:hypothetical protein J3A83DRAFT_4262695, partial [Scleroderma citrinum]
GDVRDRILGDASQKLQATTYPFATFLSLQPRRNVTPSSYSSSSPVLTVLSRHSGRSVLDSRTTSTQSVITHLEQQLPPRVKPFRTRHTTARAWTGPTTA